MVYVPSFNSNNCVVISNGDTIRVYDRIPTNNTTTYYTDYYINSHYLSVRGSTNYNYNVNCISSDNITTNWIYRNDLVDILLIFILICIIIIIPFRFVFKKFLRRFF